MIAAVCVLIASSTTADVKLYGTDQIRYQTRSEIAGEMELTLW